MMMLAALQIDLEEELRKTRRILEVVPDDKPDWRPHPKSMPLGTLAKHVPMLLFFGAQFFKSNTMDLAATPPPPVIFKGREDLLATLDAGAKALHEAMALSTEEEMMQDWTFTMGDKVLYTARRAVVFRTMCLNHLIHHRGQLTVYLRLLDVPVPGIYGPSADGPWEVSL